MRSLACKLLLPVALLATQGGEAQACGWSRIDHMVTYDASGPWNPNVYRSGIAALTFANIGGTAWEGAQTRLGRTMWQGVDAQFVAGVSAEAGKRIFARVRPEDGDNPCLWFEGGNNKSFPSLESAVTTALVTPYVLEYAAENPAAYALLMLPPYVGAARVKNQAHWQSDVLAGWAVGGLSGWLSHSLGTPISIRLLPDGFAIGFKTQFWPVRRRAGSVSRTP